MSARFELVGVWLLVLGFMCSAIVAQEGTASVPKKSDWTVARNILPKDVVIQSHRGAGELSAENTLEAFELGWQLGTVPETDVRTTRDGLLVAFHDGNFKRVVRDLPEELVEKGVKDVTWEQLAQLDVGSYRGEEFAGRRVPRLAEVFQRMSGRPERQFYIDIKAADLEQLASEVREHGVERQVILASTKYDVIREWKRLSPPSQTLHWMGGSEAELTQRLAQLRETGFADITQLQIHVHRKDDSPVTRGSVDPFKVSDQFLIDAGRELRGQGITFQTYAYGGESIEMYWKLLDLGVMSFATAHPNVALDAVRTYRDE
jgi:glycerophosphoryl diester phosphodiesterase